MPIPEERLYRGDKLNKWFAISSIAMTASILWLIQIDYKRPWHQYQDSYAVNKAALAHLEYIRTQTSSWQETYDEAQARLSDARELAEKTSGAQRAKLVSELADAELEFKKVSAPWGQIAQVLEVTRDTLERTKGEHGPNHPATRDADRAVREQEAEEEALRKEKEHWEDEKKRIAKEIKLLDEPVKLAERRVKDLDTIRYGALEKDQQYRGVLGESDGLRKLFGDLPIVRAVVQMPLLDFAAPKGTPGRYQVNQLVLPKIRQQLNYLETYTTDRCTTCHVSIAEPEFSKEELAKKLERAYPGVVEAMASIDAALPDPPTAPTVDGTQLEEGTVTDHWSELTKEQQDTYFEELLSSINSYLKANGRKTIDLGQPLLAHPNLDLYLTPDSPHNMAQVGCTVCHAGNPQETEFILAAHSPPTHEIEEEWKSKYYVKRLGITQVDFKTIAHYWDRPMVLPQHAESGCVKCHSEVADIADYHGERVGSQINLGQHLFTSVGCINCHEVDSIPDARRVGPDLAHIAEKLQPGFVEQWAFFPQKFRPSTLMPHLFLQENNGPGSENEFDLHPVLRTETEVAAISKYLFTVSKDWSPLEKPDAVEGDVERGRELFTSVGCSACHANLAEYGEKWITEDLIHREKLDKETAYHRFKGMTYEQRTRYAMKHFTSERDTFLSPSEDRFDPEQEYNRPTFSRFAPELSGIGSKVDFDWLYSWLMDPHHFSAETKMPSMRLKPGEAASLAAYLMTLQNDDFSQDPFELTEERVAKVDELVFMLLSAQRSARRSQAIMHDEGGELTNMLTSLLKGSLGRQQAYDKVSALSVDEKKLVYLGSKMITHYGCYACHNIPGFEETTPPGTNLTLWAQKPVGQLDFAFYDHAFHHMREEKEDIYGHLYRDREVDELLNYWSPGENPKEQITHTHHAFAHHKLRNPRIWDREKVKRPYDKLKMPNYYFTDKDAEALTTYLMSRVSPLVTEDLKVGAPGTQAHALAQGRILTRELNCLACHEIEDNAPLIQQFYRLESASGEVAFDNINAPPSLWGEGAKLQHPWFHDFLHNVETLRPWLQVRMPSFNLSGEQATTLVKYFAALSQRDAEKIKQKLAPINEYIANAERRADEDAVESAGDDWYEQDSLRDEAHRLREWSIEKRLMRANELDVVNTDRERFKKAHEKVLDRAQFMSSLFDVAYPFVEPARPLSPKERFELGRRFTNDMGCLKCHVLGPMKEGPARNTDEFVNVYRLDGVRGEGEDAVAILNGEAYEMGAEIDGHKLISAENIYYDGGDSETKALVEGPNAAGETELISLSAASAPNLSLTHRRLRREWVVNWMLEPGWIMPGTKMPQNFVDGKSPFAGDPNYPGTGEDHINLLVDYLYDAGMTNTRAPIVKSVVVEEEEGEFDEDEEFDD